MRQRYYTQRIQRSYFSRKENQYNESLLLNPPPHVQEELSLMIQKTIGIKKNIVDFGCGVGRLTIALLKRNKHVLGIDISESSLQVLKKVAGQINKQDFLKTSTKLTNQRAKIIMGTDILHHVDLKNQIVLLHTNLTLDGKLLFSEPNAWHIFWWIYMVIKQNWTVEKGIVQCTYFNLKRELQNAGFKRIKITGFGFFPPPFFNSYRILARINYWLGDLPILKLFAFRFIIEAW